MNGLTGTLRLTRLAARRDRVTLPAWIIGLGTFVAVTTTLFDHDLATEADLVRETRIVATNAGMRVLGIVSGPSVGGYMLHREYVTLAALAALMSTFAVVRHMRQSEELGRAEMIGATVVGRHAGLAAAVLVALGADAALAVALTVALLAAGQPASGAVLAALSVAAVGAVFVGVAAITCQVASTTRGASGMSAAALGVAFLLSGVGNVVGTVDDRGLRVSSAWPVWLSPIGWGQQMRPFDDGLWWPLLLFATLTTILLAVAARLVAARDLGRGLLPERRGHTRAGAGLRSHPGLVWRLQRGLVLGWTVGLLGFGLILGALVDQIRDIGGPAAEFYTKAAGTDVVVDAFRASIIGMAATMVAIYVVQVLLRMRVDETGGTLEPVLAGAVTRGRWLLGHVLDAALGATALVLVFAVAMGVGAALVLGDPVGQVGEMVLAGLVQLPSIAVVGGAVVLAVGVLPRWAAPVCWTLLVAVLVLGPMFGPTLGLPPWLQDLSPFTHAPKLPGTAVEAVPLVLLVGVAVILGAVGAGALRRRDLALPA
ncbi:MAG: ABC transporter permease [Nocardioides sp.]